jgi:DNA-binding response OmpR family regulator
LIEDGYRPAVAVIDQTLPDGDSAEVCRPLKHLPEGPEISCLLHSPAQDLEDLAREAGADAWLSKSSDLSKLRDHVMSLIHRDRT